MDALRSMALFVKAVELGSLTAAARDAGIGQPAMSKLISALEANLGVRLFERTTTSLNITDEGRRFYAHSKRLLEDYTEAVEDVRGQMQEVSGLLRVTAPVSIGEFRLNKLTLEFQAMHPAVDIELVLTDRLVEIVDEGFDVAIRFGRALPSNVIAKDLARVQRSMVAAPAYVDAHPAISTPSDLARHLYVGYPGGAIDETLDFHQDGKKVSVATRSRYRVNSALALRECLLEGAGLTRAPNWLVQDLLDSGHLALILPQWSVPPHKLSVLIPPRRIQPMRVRTFTAFLAERLSRLPGLYPPDDG